MGKDGIPRRLGCVHCGEANVLRPDDFESLFDSQIATLKGRGVPEQIVAILQSQESLVLKKASDLPAGRQGCFGHGNIPFLPVIPRSYRSHYDLMAMVRNGSKVGYIFFDPTAISDVVTAPSEPYYIYDVGSSITNGKTSEAAKELFVQPKRSPLVAAEIMALTTHTDVLSRHYVWATGSRWGFADRAPFISLDLCDRPMLNWGYLDGLGDHWGSASCLRFRPPLKLWRTRKLRRQACSSRE